MLGELLSSFPQGSARILDAGTGGRRWIDLTDHFVGIAKGPIVYLERNEARADKALQRHGARIDLRRQALHDLVPAHRFDLIYVDVLPAGVAKFLQRDANLLRAMIADGGLAIVTLPAEADISKTAWSVRAEGVLAHRPAEGPTFKTYALAPAGSPVAKGDFFSLGETIDFLDRMSRFAHFQSVDEYIENKLSGRTMVDGRVLHFVKHDIHHDLSGAIRFAREEARIGVHGAYFAMPPHELSARYVDRQEYVELLLEIQALGHDVGIHVDTIEAAQAGVVQYLAPFIKRLRSAGLRIRAANTHGNTKFKHPWFHGMFVLYEYYMSFGKNYNDTGGICELSGKISLKKISGDLSIDSWFDPIVYYHGQEIALDKYRMSDNYRKWCLFLQVADERPVEMLFEGTPWLASGDTADAILGEVSRAGCSYLFHPQFYR